MAPLCADPRQIVISLNPARRQALLKLANEITAYMTSQLESSSDDLGPVAPSDVVDEDGRPGESAEKASGQGSGSRRPPAPDRQSSGRAAERIQRAALRHLSDWRREFMPKLEEIVRVSDDGKIQGERRNRVQAMEKKKLDTPEEGENLISFGEVKIDKSADISSLQALYHPIPTRLTTIPSEDRREALSCVLLLLLSTGKYSAHSRTFALYLASALELPQSFLIQEETEIAKTLLESSTADDNQKEAMSAEAEAAKRREDNKFSRYWKVGLASVAGAAVIGVTGGLAAPLVAGAVGGILGGVGLGGVASFLGIFWMNGALVGALFGAFGAKMTGEMMDKYAKEVEDFKFIPLSEEWGPGSRREDPKVQQDRRLRVTIGVNGWLDSEADITKPWRVMGPETEVFALRFEMKTLLALGTALRDLVKSVAWKAVRIEIIKRTVLATLWAALWPIQVLALASNVDNPFSRASNRSRKAGELLADALINKVQGERPVTLIGYSLGATAIHACLQELASRRAFGLIDTVVIIGAPAPSSPAHWRTLRTVVSGKIFNVYSENDMILGFVYRMHTLALGVAGLQAIEGVAGVENIDLSHNVSGHLRYPQLTGEILRQCGFVGVKAGSEIEKDDEIRMKEQHGEGDLIDFDGGSAQDSEKQTHGSSRGQLADDLRGLDISPPALSNPSNTPPLPKRPAQHPEPEIRHPAADGTDATIKRKPITTNKDEQVPPLPRRQTGDAPSKQPPLPRRPTDNSRWEVTHPAAARPLTPDSNDEDDGEYVAITMVDNDDDD